ncbi:MAG: long-chain fatty acid--CoA ligase [Ignavibacteriae bacterium]|nr:long-chain fatty acid--CoA ligase [Ignavibacteriota bacterium]
MNIHKKTLVQLLIDGIKKFDIMSDILFTKKNDVYEGISRFEIVNYAMCIMNYLQGLGLRKNSNLAIISENRVEWVITDLACIFSENRTVPIYPSLSSESIKYILNDCQAEIVFVSTGLQLDKILSIKKDCPDLKYIISFNSVERANEKEHIISFQNIFCEKKSLTKNELLEKLAVISDNVKEDDLLTIIYTSGTTGIPKGVMLTHKNIYSNLETFPDVLHVSEKEVFLSYLPYSHIFERTAGYYLPFFAGSKVYYAQSIDTIALQMTEVKPTIVITVPRLLDKIYNKLMKTAVDMDEGYRKKIFNWGISVARSHWDKKNTVKWKLADKLVFTKIREKTGGKLNLFCSGGGALNRTIGEFFEGIGIVTLEGYGLTETSPVVSVNRISKNKYGTVGPPMRGVQVKIAEDGEILVKGDIVMKGYFNQPGETAEAIIDGWFHTGDIGEFDSDGFLKITDRKKSLFKSSGGKYVAPTHIEEIVSNLPYVDQILVVGNERMYVTALIVPDVNELKTLAKKINVSIEFESDLFTNPIILKTIEKDVNDVQKNLASYEKIRKFSLLQTPFTIESGELTPTLKVKRKYVEEKYKHLIDNMYHKI